MLRVIAAAEIDANKGRSRNHRRANDHAGFPISCILKSPMSRMDAADSAARSGGCRNASFDNAHARFAMLCVCYS